jgi:hypothetical protein
LSGMRTYPGVFMEPPVQAWLAGGHFNSYLSNYTFKRCQIPKTSSPKPKQAFGSGEEVQKGLGTVCGRWREKMLAPTGKKKEQKKSSFT